MAPSDSATLDGRISRHGQKHSAIPPEPGVGACSGGGRLARGPGEAGGSSRSARCRAPPARRAWCSTAFRGVRGAKRCAVGASCRRLVRFSECDNPSGLGQTDGARCDTEEDRSPTPKICAGPPYPRLAEMRRISYLEILSQGGKSVGGGTAGGAMQVSRGPSERHERQRPGCRARAAHVRTAKRRVGPIRSSPRSAVPPENPASMRRTAP